ncbi:MAG: transposase [Acidobacteria bacterium]|nr:transposase [Acidobacteriota bacterium]
MNEEKQNQTNRGPLVVADAAVNEIPPEESKSGPKDEQNPELNTTEEEDLQPRLPLRSGPAKGRSLVRKEETAPKVVWTESQRLLLLDTWRRSQLPATDFADLVGISKHSLYAWKKRFDADGPAGLSDHPRGVKKGSQLPEVTRRTILMLKEDKPEWGCQRISDALARGPGLGASAGAVARVLHEAGYELEEIETQAHPDHVRQFERAKANELWQTDLFTFMLKRQNRRVHLVGFMDDHSRFMVGYGLHATASSALVIEVMRAAIANYQAPREILTDNGSQYVTWRGKSAFARECDTRGIRQIVATPRRPQTLGKIERFWGTLWRECVSTAVFLDLEDARRRIGHFIDHYNFQRPHQGIEGLVPADRFFRAAPEVLKVLKARVAANALSLATNGIPKEPFYLTGQVAGQAFSVHAEGERVILTRQEGDRREIELVPPGEKRTLEPSEPVCPQAVPREDEGNEQPPEPGVSAIDALIGGGHE